VWLKLLIWCYHVSISYCVAQVADLVLSCFILIFFAPITPETDEVGSFFDAGIGLVIGVDYSA